MKIKYIIIISVILMLSITTWLALTTVEFAPPVKECTRNSYSQNDFLSLRDGHKHKGIDIFAKAGTLVLSATKGLVLYTGVLKLGGNVVLIIDPHLKYHYYAHLSTIETNKMSIVDIGDEVGKVGNTGNAIRTPSHLHYSISNSLKLYQYNIKGENYSIHYLNPRDLLNKYFDDKKL